MITIEIFDWNFVISIMSSFIIGLLSMIIYNKLKRLEKASISQRNETIIEAIVSEYSLRLKDFEKIITELRLRIDTMELRTLQHPVSQTPTIFTDNDRMSYEQSTISQHHSHQPEQSPASHVSKTMTTITQQQQPPTITVTEKNSVPITQNSTLDYILKLLSERPRTSREIQHAIGRTREHTSRLMKGLYEMNLVTRESNIKPFKYAITDAGRIKLNAHQQTNHSEPQTAVESYSSKYPSGLQSQTAI
jgi:DNA-binding MarR family transcriptional regulator